MSNRAVRLHAHSDRINAWRQTRLAPPANLASHIFGYSDYWERTGSFTTRRELPHAEGVLLINLGAPIALTGGNGAPPQLGPGEAFIAGVHLAPALSHSSGAQAGMHVFLPLSTLRRLLATPMDRLVDQVVNLETLLGAPARQLGQTLLEAPTLVARVAVLDAALTALLEAAPPLDPQLRHALRLLRHRPTQDIAAIAAEIGWSRKHLADRVKNVTGVGPRCLRRLLRFQSLLAAIPAGPNPNWADLACVRGYCDQSHLIREFQEFSGLTPTAYLARRLPAGGGLVEH
jgi:AraC-like DNA-binding protein